MLCSSKIAEIQDYSHVASPLSGVPVNLIDLVSQWIRFVGLADMCTHVNPSDTDVSTGDLPSRNSKHRLGCARKKWRLDLSQIHHLLSGRKEGDPVLKQQRR